jgi:hypothetical protein
MVLFKMDVHYKELIPGKEYMIAHKEDFYKGTFVEYYQRYFEYNPKIIFMNVRESYTNRKEFREHDKFYEIECK